MEIDVASGNEDKQTCEKPGASTGRLCWLKEYWFIGALSDGENGHVLVLVVDDGEWDVIVTTAGVLGCHNCG